MNTYHRITNSWDYTNLASTYEKRPDYASKVIERLIYISSMQPGDLCCDMGAGTGRLTRHLANAGLIVDAVEPNEAMRNIGQKMTDTNTSIRWVAATAENSGLPSNKYSLVTFGSSFNVIDREKALNETVRILRPSCWFACLWNHRDLSDNLQAEIENLISNECPEYSYGSRREDQTEIIQKSGLFQKIFFFESRVNHIVNADDWIYAWYSHATLARQAGKHLSRIVEAIGEIVRGRCSEQLEIPYVTRMWVAQSKDKEN